MERQYEAVFIISSKLSEEELNNLKDELRNIIAQQQDVKILETISQQRNFAYPIKKETKGTYLTIRFTAPPSVIAVVKEAIKHREDILRTAFLKKD
ncbi:MAG: 30S ribosomal protein S6 [candidate division WOR-3 bacterium]|nr:30S ribosomal protein S6 [candidate division WOR-3 bacterium]